MTGYELLKEVRADPGLSKTPFIMVTAELKTENVIAAKKAGVNNYIVKPFNAQTLKTKIERSSPDARSAGARRGRPLTTQLPHHGLRHAAGGGESRRQRCAVRAARVRPVPRRECPR